MYSELRSAARASSANRVCVTPDVNRRAAISATVPSVWIAFVVLCGGVAAIAAALAACRIVRLEPASVLRRL